MSQTINPSLIGSHLGYPFWITLSEPGWYHVTYPDFPNLTTGGRTLDEALVNAQEGLEGLIEAYEADNTTHLLPGSKDQFSGKILVRMEPSLHRILARLASFKGIPLNDQVVYFIKEGVGFLADHDPLISARLASLPVGRKPGRPMKAGKETKMKSGKGRRKAG
jgi:predicted RNase H-like HicB family nuclease